ncbi:S8 family serine peptidase [Streptomyces heilongjiangensis]|uniref:S8 family serine peptidase n=1 Tax=Streptomyces heilongjiangensis TaxID=945052 RepID=A0ABW1BKK8_9ACTN|nr:S8 family serine peptidase [Streptomyces heilongjiangensis]MDC2952487.1 S8 family serine peptidase [Streptomyces heilongjiangensis]
MAAGLVLGLGQPGWAGSDTSSPSAFGPGAQQRMARNVTVTLLTGDRVTVSTGENQRATVQPAPGREDLRFFTRSVDGDLHVVPEDADSLIRSGKVDERLFNISALLRYGYQDTARPDLPVMIRYRAVGTRTTARGTLGEVGAEVTRELPAIGGAAVTVSKRRAAEVWQALTPADGSAARLDSGSGVDRIWLDGKRELALDKSVSQIGAPAAWEAGYTGKGVTVAVLDGGVDVDHPDLVGRVAYSENFTTSPETRDTVGHGTHVASTIAGSGAASGGKYKGVAPDATLVSGKVCPDRSCDESAMLAGMEWAAVEKKAAIVNISIGGGDTPAVDPLEEAVNTLTRQTGTLFVIAAGNSGSGRYSLDSPGTADAALTVGAVDKSDQLAPFSSRGPRLGDDVVKPDLTAPGVDIVAARAEGTAMGTPVDDHYTSASGTSMATPHVAGAAALLAQQHPDWRASRLKPALTASAQVAPGQSVFEQGAGRVDLTRALVQTVTADASSLSFGRALWPHTDDNLVDRTVTYTNDGDSAVTLDLDVQVAGPDGATAPAGLFTASARRVTVPAGGRAEVTLTADTRVDAADGVWSGRLVATGPSTRLVTPFSVHREVESYDVTVTDLDANGEPTGQHNTVLVNLDTDIDTTVWEPDGRTTVRLPKGRYGLSSRIFTDGGVAVLARPELVLDEDTSITVDARDAKPVEVTATLPRKSAMLFQSNVGYSFSTARGTLATFGVMGSSFDGISIGQIGSPASGAAFSALVSGQWADSGTDGTYGNSPYLYASGEVVKGRMPVGFRRSYTQRDFAAIRQDFHDPAGGELGGFRYVDPVVGMVAGYALQVPVPGKRVEYVTEGLEWSSALWLNDGTVLESPLRSYRAGRSYEDPWNTAPFGPSSRQSRAFTGVSRLGDRLTVSSPLFGDAAGHPGDAPVSAARTALYRNGELSQENKYAGFGRFTMGADPATYRLETSGTRATGDLSTRVDVAWTFRSAHADRYTRPALLGLRFSPRLDADNAAPGGTAFTVPFTVNHQAGSSGGGKVRKPTVEVSYDDGRTWQSARVAPAGKGWTAQVRHPAGPGFVSLRTTATDTVGNSVVQTVIHAYRLT